MKISYLALVVTVLITGCQKSTNAIVLNVNVVDSVIRKEKSTTPIRSGIRFKLRNETKETVEFGYETICVQLNWSTDSDYVSAIGPTSVRLNAGAKAIRLKPGETFSGNVGIAISPSAPLGVLDFHMKLHSTMPPFEKIKPSFSEVLSDLVHIEVRE